MCDAEICPLVTACVTVACESDHDWMAEAVLMTDEAVCSPTCTSSLLAFQPPPAKITRDGPEPWVDLDGRDETRQDEAGTELRHGVSGRPCGWAALRVSDGKKDGQKCSKNGKAAGAESKPWRGCVSGH